MATSGSAPRPSTRWAWSSWPATESEGASTAPSPRAAGGARWLLGGAPGGLHGVGRGFLAPPLSRRGPRRPPPRPPPGKDCAGEARARTVAYSDARPGPRGGDGSSLLRDADRVALALHAAVERLAVEPVGLKDRPPLARNRLPAALRHVLIHASRRHVRLVVDPVLARTSRQEADQEEKERGSEGADQFQRYARGLTDWPFTMIS